MKKTNSYFAIIWSVAVIAALTFITSVPTLAQGEGLVAVFRKLATTERDDRTIDVSRVQGLTLRLNLEVTVAPNASQEQMLLAYLKRADTYSFTSDWPGVDNTTEIGGDNLPFLLDRAPDARLIDGATLPRYRVILHGQCRGRTRGEVRVKMPPIRSDGVTWQLKREDDATSDPLVIRYSAGQDWKLQPFRGRGQLGFGGGGPSFDFNGSGVLSGGRSIDGTTVTSLAIAGKLALRRPDDVRDTPGAEKDASKDIADTVELSLNRIGYRRGGSLQRLGLKTRATGSLKGLEVVGYYAPLTAWYNQSRGFYALELEVGYRQGDAEFKNLTTRAANPGNLVARLGSVVEWAPRLGGINRNLSKGLRFFARGRGWLDTYKNSDDNFSLRFRPFVDSELFFNFSDDNRIFVRGEYGYLPPDLSGRSSRIYAGVGKAF